jgi:hypothetical protein
MLKYPSCLIIASLKVDQDNPRESNKSNPPTSIYSMLRASAARTKAPAAQQVHTVRADFPSAPPN